jgi:hypothetical protein
MITIKIALYSSNFKFLSFQQDIYKEFVEWRGKIDQRLMGISSSLGGLQVSEEHLIFCLFFQLFTYYLHMSLYINQLPLTFPFGQSMYKDVMTWKSKTEQQLKEISNSLSSMQASKQCTALNPVSERWEDWLESTNLDNIQGEDFAPWLENTDLVNFKQNASPQEQEPYNAIQPWLKHSDNPSQEPVCAGELELLKEEMAKMKR